MKRILILEDSQERIEKFLENLAPDMVYTTDRAHEAIHKLETEEWDVLFLDHDLGDTVGVSIHADNTGSTVAQWLHDHPDRKPRLIVIHSYNAAGQRNMKMLLPESVVVPTAWNVITSRNLTESNIEDLEDLARRQYKRMIVG